METLEIIDEKNKKVGQVDLPKDLFDKKVNKVVLFQEVKRLLAGKHHGTVKTKSRGEVNRTTKKVYRQKGTGNARHGSRKSSPFVGGGRVFGPRPRDYSLKVQKKVKRLAVRDALKSQILENRIKVVDQFPLKEIKTAHALKYFKTLNINSGLVIVDETSDVIEKSVRNLKDFKVIRVDQLNILDLFKYPTAVFTAKSFQIISDRYLSL